MRHEVFIAAEEGTGVQKALMAASFGHQGRNSIRAMPAEQILALRDELPIAGK